MDEKVSQTIDRPNEKAEKAKKVPESWKWTFLKGQYLKPSNIISFYKCQKKIVEFTNSNHTIYWPTNIAKKAEIETTFMCPDTPKM